MNRPRPTVTWFLMFLEPSRSEWCLWLLRLVQAFRPSSIYSAFSVKSKLLVGSKDSYRFHNRFHKFLQKTCWNYNTKGDQLVHVPIFLLNRLDLHIAQLRAIFNGRSGSVVGSPLRPTWHNMRRTGSPWCDFFFGLQKLHLVIRQIEKVGPVEVPSWKVWGVRNFCIFFRCFF